MAKFEIGERVRLLENIVITDRCYVVFHEEGIVVEAKFEDAEWYYKIKFPKSRYIWGTSERFESTKLTFAQAVERIRTLHNEKNEENMRRQESGYPQGFISGLRVALDILSYVE